MKKLSVRKLDPREEFDHFVTIGDNGDCLPVVLDLDLITGKACILTDTGRGSIPKDVWCGNTQRFKLPIVPTPWSAADLLDFPRVCSVLQEMLDYFALHGRNEDEWFDLVAHAENTINDACERSVLGIAVIDAKEWFSGRKDCDIYNLYDFASKSDKEIERKIQKEWHGCCISGDYVLYLTDIDLYVRGVRGSVENTD